MPPSSLPARFAAKSQAIYTPIVVQELQRLEEDLGGRGELVGLLSLAPLTKDLQYVLGLLGDPLNRAQSLAAICAQGGILPADLVRHLQSATLTRGKVLASLHIGRGVAAVAADVMRKAAPYEDTCNGGCQGTGTIAPNPTPQQPNPSPGPCMTCQGTGRLVYQPVLETQKLALELAEMLKKGGGINILNQQTNNTANLSAGGGGTIEQFHDLTDRLLYGDLRPPAIDVEATPVEPEPPPPDADV